ncbi:hypothetical protein [Rhizobium nepotum]|uniref:hypothetical protein n=1 Tax=Rhizobium nepotum TaxID=1035271 RepID=UPI003CEC13BC
MKIDYTYVGAKVFTEVSERAEDGTPLYSRFGEYLTEAQVKSTLVWLRKHDRNAS